MTHRNGWTITATINGLVKFPDHPTHEGVWGLLGGEDVQAQRSSFRSVGEAMTWARKVLDGDHAPRWSPVGKLYQPHTEPSWASARVVVSNPYDYDANDIVYETYDGTREWCLDDDGRHVEVVRTDWPLPA